MEKAPGVLFYNISKYAGLEVIPVMELFSTRIKNKLHGNQSGFQYLLNKYYNLSDNMKFSDVKNALKELKKPLVSVRDGTDQLFIYYISLGYYKVLKIKGLPSVFNCRANWVLMNSTHVLMGCGISPNGFNEQGRRTGIK